MDLVVEEQVQLVLLDLEIFQQLHHHKEIMEDGQIQVHLHLVEVVVVEQVELDSIQLHLLVVMEVQVHFLQFLDHL